MNGYQCNVPNFTFPRNVVPHRSPVSSGVSFTTFIVFAIIVLFLISEVYNYARKVCMDHQRRMRMICVSHQTALESKLKYVCSTHQKLFEEFKTEEVRCKCKCKCRETESENCESDEKENENDFEEIKETRGLCTIPEDEPFIGLKEE